ncbi:hypothetical protein BH23ACT12_BH23ACT12_22090 [soil metagenome]
MSNTQLYDTIGATYTVTRRTEPRIAAPHWRAVCIVRALLLNSATELTAASLRLTTRSDEKNSRLMG